MAQRSLNGAKRATQSPHAVAVAISIVFIALTSIAHAQTAAPTTLANATTLKCVFSVMASGTWTATGESQGALRATNLTLEFDAINTQEGTAHLVGFTGTPFITVRLFNTSLHILAMDGGGPLYVTTVFGKESRNGKLRAVHTRHEYTDVSLPGFTSTPEQYYGECDVK
jgi:hypothetical protein